MFVILLKRYILCLLLVFITCEIKTSEVSRPRGVSLSRASLYLPEKDFVCLDSSLSIPFTQVNDNYCDCPDGSDEPGTSACPNGSFYCTNAGHKPLILPSSRVNDGICDCCDASDEYDSPKTKCINNCHELGRTARAEAQKRVELVKIGSQLRAELSQKGVLLKQEKREKLLVLNRNKNEAEQLKKEKEALKKEAEELENVALDAYRKIKDEENKLNQMFEEEEKKLEAMDIFEKYDSNQNGKLEILELQTRTVFDRDHDGEISEIEAKYYLNDKDEIDFDEYYTSVWPKIKPLIMMKSGIFKPPAEEHAETDDMHELEEENEDDQGETEAEAEEGEADDMVDDLADDEDIDTETHQDVETLTESDQSNTKYVYDDETQRLINIATEARSEFNKADQALRDIQNEIKTIEESLLKDYGKDEEFASLDGQCFEYSDREYIYKLCPFDQVTQRPKSGGSETRLGQWGSWVGTDHTDLGKYDVMLYDRGQSCWNGPQRSTHVRILCGSEIAVTSVAEPNRCEYVMDFVTPAACNPLLFEKNTSDSHDEL